MTNAVTDTILSHNEAKYYDPTATLNFDELTELIRVGTSVAMEFHLQNWRILAIHTPEAKARLSAIAWHQSSITDASVTFIVISKFSGPHAIHDRPPSSAELSSPPVTMGLELEAPERDLYLEIPRRLRNEALRNGGIAAAAMIYAANSLGFSSFPMLSFNVEDVAREFCLTENEIPFLLLAVGKECTENLAQQCRHWRTEVLNFV